MPARPKAGASKGEEAPDGSRAESCAIAHPDPFLGKKFLRILAVAVALRLVLFIWPLIQHELTPHPAPRCFQQGAPSAPHGNSITEQFESVGMCFGVDEMTMDEREEHARLVSNVYSNSEHSRESDTRALRERAWLRGLSHRMRSRFELTTPLTSHMRLREGLFTASRLRANPAVGDETAKPMSPYSSGVSHASPLLLWLLSPFGAATHASDGTPIPGVLLDTPFFIIAVLADVAIAFSLRVIAQFYFVRPVGSLLREARTPVRSSPGSAGTAAAAPADAQTNPASNSSESHRAERAEPPSAPPDPLPADPVRAAFALDLAPGVYLFLPMTVLGTVGLSSANLAPAAVLAAAAFAVSAQRARPDFPAMDQALSPRLSESVAGALTGACSAVAIMLDVQSALLVPALVALAVNVNNTLDGVRDSSGTPDADKSGPSLRQTAPAAAHSVGGALVPFLSAFAAVAAVGLGCARQVAPLEHIWDQVVGVSLHFSEYVPNVGIQWYFFPQIFSRFRTFFSVLFLAHPLVYVSAALVRLNKWPLFNVWLAVAVSGVFKPYPTAIDLAITLALLVTQAPLVSQRIRRVHIHFLVLLNVSAMGEMMWFLWIYVGTGNANFVFFQTIVYNFATVFLCSECVVAVRRLECSLDTSKAIEGEFSR